MTTDEAAESLLAFTRRLNEIYGAMVPADDSIEHRRMTLSLTSTLLKLSLEGPRQQQAPLQIAVIGPTQVGKSTVVNLLLGSEHAVASPLAAYTRELEGFALMDKLDNTEWISRVLGDTHISLRRVDGGGGVASIVWDTPDFDSHRSQQYRTLIASIGALADVFVLVVSKEKYSDLAVWNTVNLLQPLQRKLVVCLNKVSSDQDVLTAAVESRLAEYGLNPGRTPVVVLPFTPSQNAAAALMENDVSAGLHRMVFQDGHRCGPDCRHHGLTALIEQNWNVWLEPVRREIEADQNWHQTVAQYTQDALTVYEQQYLNNSAHNDAFNRAVLRLLELLEIPGIAAPLTQLRSVLTWPVKKFIAMFDDTDEAGNKVHSESNLLHDVVQHALLELRVDIAKNAEQDGQAGTYWQALLDCYAAAAERIRLRLPVAVAEYQHEFEPEIERAAESLYARLKEKPIVLNALRASRVGADAAGVLVAVNTGTVGVADAVLTPAMLSLTSMLTEGVVGQFVESVKDDLRERQRTLVDSMFKRELETVLLALPDQATSPGLFLISDEELHQVEHIKTRVLA